MWILDVELSPEDLAKHKVRVPTQGAPPLRVGERVIVRDSDGQAFVGTVIARVDAPGDLVINLHVKLPPGRRGGMPTQRSSG